MLHYYKAKMTIIFLRINHPILNPINTVYITIKCLKNLELPHLTFHALRHTFATRCIECGCDYKSLSELLGHSNVSITMNIYVHPQMELKRKCVELLCDYYK